jgi:maltose O-acetyltransferase
VNHPHDGDLSQHSLEGPPQHSPEPGKTRSRYESVRLAARSVRQDVAWAFGNLYLNGLCASFFTPRVLRWALYRARGLDVRTPNVFPRCTITGGRDVTIGEGTFLNRGVYLEAVAPISIGRDCQVAMQVLIVTSTHPIENGRFGHDRVGRPVTIGDRCWIGARAIVLPGVTIGDDVVVAAGAVVTADCTPGGLYAGIPARRIRDLVPQV